MAAVFVTPRRRAMRIPLVFRYPTNNLLVILESCIGLIESFVEMIYRRYWSLRLLTVSYGTRGTLSN